MSDILDRILAVKFKEVEQARAACPLSDLQAAVQELAPCRGFARALQDRVSQGLPAVIAEVKKASPSKGVICENFCPEAAALDYETHGAACLSVLTDKTFFQGSRQALQRARSASKLPILRKDFLVDPYQVYEARLWGADAVLVIMRAVDDALAMELAQTALRLGLDVLVETHDEEEIERALKLPATLIGINNRNLQTFKTNIEHTLSLRHFIPDDRVLVTESGIRTGDDVRRLREAGVSAFLVGEAFMREASPGQALKQLFDL